MIFLSQLAENKHFQNLKIFKRTSSVNGGWFSLENTRGFERFSIATPHSHHLKIFFHLKNSKSNLSTINLDPPHQISHKSHSSIHQKTSLFFYVKAFLLSLTYPILTISSHLSRPIHASIIIPLLSNHPTYLFQTKLQANLRGHNFYIYFYTYLVIKLSLPSILSLKKKNQVSHKTHIIRQKIGNKYM